MRRQVVALVLLVVAGFVLWVYTSATHIIWDGGFTLTVRVSSDPGRPRPVTCEAFSCRERAEYALEHLLPPETGSRSATADPFTGEPLTVDVPVNGRESMSGRQLSRFQFRYLVVVVVLPDGRRTGKLVDIPDGRVSREMSVAFP